MDLCPDLSYILLTWFDDTREYTDMTDEAVDNSAIDDISDNDIRDTISAITEAEAETSETAGNENSPNLEDPISHHFPDFETEEQFHDALRYFTKWILEVPEEQYQQWFLHNGRECDFLEMYCRFEDAEYDAMAAVHVGGDACCGYHQYLEDRIF